MLARNRTNHPDIPTEPVDTAWRMWREITVELGDAQREAGLYEVTFRYTHRAHRLDVARVALLENGQELMRDTHPGTTGNQHQDNRYRITLSEQAFDTRDQLKARIRSAGGNDSHGVIRMKNDHNW